jgi:hypothetical protein
MAHSDESAGQPGGAADGKRFHFYLIVLIVTAAVYAGCMISPPSLMDDVDAVQAQIARNMLTSGDWVTARLDGVPYLEKSPLIYWLIAESFKFFGATDWAARVPRVLRRFVHGDVRRPFSFHAHSDSGRDAYFQHRAFHVGVPQSH